MQPRGPWKNVTPINEETFEEPARRAGRRSATTWKNVAINLIWAAALVVIVALILGADFG